MVGSNEDKGIVPRVCEQLFNTISNSPAPNTEYTVEVSMLEIYNERVRDLLNPKNNPPNGLEVRENVSTGPYVDGLSSCVCRSLAEINKFMEQGTAARTSM